MSAHLTQVMSRGGIWGVFCVDCKRDWFGYPSRVEAERIGAIHQTPINVIPDRHFPEVARP